MLAARGHPAAGRKVLQEMQFLREQMFKAYEPVMRPTRRREAIDWIFASMLAAMEAVCRLCTWPPSRHRGWRK